jgi:hypothetical protein
VTTAPTVIRRRLPHSRHPWPFLGLLAASVLLCALWGILAAAEEPVGSVYKRSAPVSAAALPSSSPVAAPPDSPAPARESADAPPESAAAQAGRADRVITAALAGMARAPTLSARVRHLVRVGDIVLKGSGRYVQSGVGEDQRYRYEYRLSGFKEDFEVLDVCDGLFAWNFRRVGPNPPQVERIDVRRIRERLETLGVAHRKDQSAYLGGIQRHLSLLRHYYRFKTITSGSIDDMPVWIVEGLWDKDALAWIVKDQAEAIKSEAGVGPHEIPDGIPWSVRLSISKRELFPCRVEWFAVPGRRPTAAATPQVVATMELYDVRIGDPVDVSAFVYKPATEGLTDITDAYIPQVYPLPQ